MQNQRNSLITFDTQLKTALTQIKSNINFWGEGKTGVRGEKPLGADTRMDKLNPNMTSNLGIEPESHC